MFKGIDQGGEDEDAHRKEEGEHSKLLVAVFYCKSRTIYSSVLMLDKKTIVLRDFFKSQVIIIWVIVRMRYDFKSRCQRASEKTILTCFSESLEGARMPSQLEDPNNSEHFDNPDQSEENHDHS